MNIPSCGTCSQLVLDLNGAIPDWASKLSTSRSPITTVDQWTGFDDTSDTRDGVYPNTSGAQKMAKVWFPAVVAALGRPIESTLVGFLNRLLEGIL